MYGSLTFDGESGSASRWLGAARFNVPLPVHAGVAGAAPRGRAAAGFTVTLPVGEDVGPESMSVMAAAATRWRVCSPVAACASSGALRTSNVYAMVHQDPGGLMTTWPLAGVKRTIPVAAFASSMLNC